MKVKDINLRVTSQRRKFLQVFVDGFLKTFGGLRYSGGVATCFRSSTSQSFLE